MVFYHCQRCGYKTQHKNDFRKHVNKKNPCSNKLNEENKINILCDQKNKKKIFKMNTPYTKRKKFPKNSQKYTHKYTHKLGNYTQKYTQKNSEINDKQLINCKKFKCQFCKKSFTTYRSKWRHEKNYCKGKKDIQEQIYNLQEEIDLLKKENKVINFENNITNYNNIVINNFGKENIDYITDSMLKKMLKQGSKSIPKLIKEIHFNPNHPENHNIRIKNKKLKYAEIRENNKWKYKHKKAVLDDLVDFGYVTLEEFQDNKKLDQLLRKGFSRLMNKYETEKNDLLDEVELEVLNGMNDINI